MDSNKKKKILHVSYGGLGNGGVTSVIISIFSSLYQKYDFGCITFPGEGRATREHIVRQYSKIYSVNCYGKNGLMKLIELIKRPFVMYRSVKKICKEENYDVIHCHNGMDMFYCLLAAKHAGVTKRIAHSHNSPSPKKPPFYKKIVFVLQNYLINKLCTHRVGCSKLACEAMFNAYPYRVIFNSINSSDYPWNRTQHEGLEIIHVGRYDYQKNQLFILDVVNILKKSIKDLHVQLFGFGTDEEKLLNRINSLNLGNIVELKDGKKSNIPEAFAKSDIMIFPSVYEGFGIVLIEAQSSGCYCFVSDVVPSDTNIGMMEQLSLSLGAEQWANRIVNYWLHTPKNLLEKFDNVNKNIQKFDNNTISKQYISLYEE
ncbi:glycosyltransferase [uncultured Bacteroides sp.]|jgi:glycosyltransferase EpsF|uniref:glycosyltransferase n=1 Tax=uncultured Bacteroides sp. TaxID=162156 RepID=UPI0025E54990|nr:glycosyltransferase [uncultured Bacteroides sp.]